MEEESHSTTHESIQPHLMKDIAWLSWEWSAQYQESGGNRLIAMWSPHDSLEQFMEVQNSGVKMDNNKS